MSALSSIAAEAMRVADETRHVCSTYDGDGFRWSAQWLNGERSWSPISGDDLARLTRGPR
ncbi:hypothetical protein GCM10027079_02280 [Sediminivirga luteola]|uniref:Uncharacterized protein n=1 Tax=Sediminivirga luteola TaxID=1774748 RepID=A0A8J2TX47_9MICO|nr:hypothetical protein GCM10011333_12360 [Sediminivirga luteola]